MNKIIPRLLSMLFIYYVINISIKHLKSITDQLNNSV